jgi:hypothetical protein
MILSNIGENLTLLNNGSNGDSVPATVPAPGASLHSTDQTQLGGLAHDRAIEARSVGWSRAHRAVPGEGLLDGFGVGSARRPARTCRGPPPRDARSGTAAPSPPAWPRTSAEPRWRPADHSVQPVRQRLLPVRGPGPQHRPALANLRHGRGAFSAARPSLDDVAAQGAWLETQRMRFEELHQQLLQVGWRPATVPTGGRPSTPGPTLIGTPQLSLCHQGASRIAKSAKALGTGWGWRPRRGVNGSGRRLQGETMRRP